MLWLVRGQQDGMSQRRVKRRAASPTPTPTHDVRAHDMPFHHGGPSKALSTSVEFP